MTRVAKTASLFLLIVTTFGLPPQRHAEAQTWVTRLNHVFGVTLEVPAGWAIEGRRFTDMRFDRYRGADGSVYLDARSFTATSLGTICQENSLGSPYEVFTGPNGSLCLIQPTNTVLDWVAIIPYPAPRRIVYPDLGTATHVRLSGTRAQLRRIAESVDTTNVFTAPLFVAGALDLWQANHVSRESIDWDTLRAEALTRVNAGSTLDDAYAALRFVAERLLALAGDDHGYVRTRAEAERYASGASRRDVGVLLASGGWVSFVAPGSAAEQAGLRVGDRVISINGAPPDGFTPPAEYAELTFVFRQQGTGLATTVTVPAMEYPSYIPARGRRLPGGIGYVETFGLTALDVAVYRQYASEAHALFRSLDAEPRCGWIVDVRRNTGGVTAPIMSGLIPLLENGVIFQWRDGDNVWSPVSIIGNQIYGLGFGGQSLVSAPYRVQNSAPPIAILVSENTASNGEFSAFTLLYRQRGPSRAFGERTPGLTTGTYGYMLLDGGRLEIESITGGRYNRILWPSDGLVPDVPMTPDYTQYGGDGDPMIQAARQWLREQPACQGVVEMGSTTFLPMVRR